MRPGTLDANGFGINLQDNAMTNPWLKKNPYMSLWLSGANTVANTARAQVTAEVKRQSHDAIGKAMGDMMTFWTGGFGGAPALKPARRRRR